MKKYTPPVINSSYVMRLLMNDGTCSDEHYIYRYSFLDLRPWQVHTHSGDFVQAFSDFLELATWIAFYGKEFELREP